MEGFALIYLALIATAAGGFILLAVATARRASPTARPSAQAGAKITASLAATFVSLLLFLLIIREFGDRTNAYVLVRVCASLGLLSASAGLVLAIWGRGHGSIASGIAAAWFVLAWVPVLIAVIFAL